MSSAREQFALLEAQYASISPPQRLSMAAELLEWTVANFDTPINDRTVADLVSRAQIAINAAVDAGLSAAPADPALTDQLFSVAEDTNEPGAFNLLGAFRLCFDHIEPEITPQRLLGIFDRCYQADYVRYTEPAIAVGEGDPSARGQRIFARQAELRQRYLP
ncbi:hypothetical protein [Glycomyces sp. NPDC048151]|uniref:hypothetical protein n=1 Tax=Glycomyces sp. NPDC048151 TaxID=3364002 RepID=UPI003715D166